MLENVYHLEGVATRFLSNKGCETEAGRGGLFKDEQYRLARSASQSSVRSR
jgi:hypothetical protein